MLTELHENDFDTKVKASEKPVVLKFTADWWPGCKQLAPVVSSVSEDLSDQVEFYSVDVDQNPNLSKQYGVMSIPTMVLFKEGKEVGRLSGAVPEEAVREFSTQ